MRLTSLVSRRPSPALAVSVTALFISLGGAGYAAVSLPDNSVGNAQLQDGAVSYLKIQPNSVGRVRLADGGVINSKLAGGSVSFRDIQPGAVGIVRANTNQLQVRVSGTCGAGSAIGAVDNTGKVTCNSSLPEEFGTTSNTVTLTTAPGTESTLTLPAGPSYLAFANPTVTATSGATVQRVAVHCTLTVGSERVTRRIVVATTGIAGETSTGAIPLQLAGPAGTSTVSCIASPLATGTLPTISAVAQINALQTSSNS